MRQLVSANAPAATVLVRLLVGSVPLSEGIQKFLYPAELAAGCLHVQLGAPRPRGINDLRLHEILSSVRLHTFRSSFDEFGRVARDYVCVPACD